MTDKKVWFITGAGRGMGVDIAKAALAAGHAVVATGRNTDAVAKAVGEADDLLVVKLDVTSRADAEAAVQAAVDRFGRIDVLVNNAGNFYAGYFEELTPEQIERQLATSLIGPMNVTRAVLPVMRKQRSGHIISISSSAGLVGFEFCSAYAASKFGLEGWMESLQPEVAPFGIHTTIVNPGFFRTELLTQESTTYAEPSIEDYAERTAAQREWWKAQNGQQAGDPAKLAQALRHDRRARSSRRAASSPAPMPSPPPSRRSPISRRRSTPTATCRPPSQSRRDSRGFSILEEGLEREKERVMAKEPTPAQRADRRAYAPQAGPAHGRRALRRRRQGLCHKGRRIHEARFADPPQCTIRPPLIPCRKNLPPLGIQDRHDHAELRRGIFRNHIQRRHADQLATDGLRHTARWLRQSATR